MAFEPVPSPFVEGEHDESATQEKFMEFVGGTAKAERLDQLYHSSHPHGTEYGRLSGRGKTKDEVFRDRAKWEGFSDKQIDAYLML